VYSATRPFNRFRFVIELQKWQRSWLDMGKELTLKEEAETLTSIGEGGDSALAARKSPPGGAAASPLAPVLRSKGLLWLDTQPKDALYWSHAGRCASFSHWGQWTGALAPADGMSSSKVESGTSVARLLGRRGMGLGSARTEMVFIGAGLDEAAVRSVLDQCLVSEDEFAVARKAMEPHGVDAMSAASARSAAAAAA